MTRMLLFLLLAWTIISCNSNGEATLNEFNQPSDTVLPKVIAGNFSNQQDIKLDSSSIDRFLSSHDHFVEFKKDLHTFYRNRNYAMAWFDSTGMIEQANILFNRIMKMQEDGMTLDIPYIEEYTSLMKSPAVQSNPRMELMQTSQYLHYVKKLLFGISEEQSKSLEWFIPRKKTNYIELLDSILVGDTLLENKNVFPQYDLLKEKLASYRQIEKNGGWDSIHLVKRNVKLGDRGNHVVALKKRLLTSGEYAQNDTSNIFDTELEDAVKSFQRSHGLMPDGIVSKMTITEMNVSIRERIEQIIINMERTRWLPRPTRKSYLLINIPQFKLYVYDNDSLFLSCKVVVGKETNRTAIFKGDMKYVVFSPYWNVPTNIMNKEVLPAIKRNKNYLLENHMEWYGNSIRQLPGPWNALGGVKFVFPNGYDIYLHDTPSKLLFNETTRTFSHGCIRISEPKKLAMFLLSGNGDWNEEAIDSAMISRIEKFVPLKKPVPVYVVYFTAFVGADGVLNFSKDVYSRDVQLKKMILN